jgi:hypothetical protein
MSLLEGEEEEDEALAVEEVLEEELKGEEETT